MGYYWHGQCDIALLRWEDNKIKKYNFNGFESRHHHLAGRTHQDEDEGQPHPQLYARTNPADSEENRAAFLFQESQKRTDQWSDNLKDLKKRKEEERFKKFEKEEL
jgi:hypothetical protein